MRISSKSRFAIMTMLELAVTRPDKAIRLSEIADSHGISISYLEQIIASLREKGLVVGKRGPGGGYVLGKEAAEISISAIIAAVDEWVEYSQEKIRTNKFQHLQLTTRSLWDDLSLRIYDYLKGISLQDLIDNNYQLFADKAA